jgi:hydrophobe/amphiphile efflux-3 (HAE3) family protein
MIDPSAWVANNARVVIVVMLLTSAVVAGGISMLDRSTSLDQFQTDADEAEALEYADENFGGGTANTTRAQVIVEDDNVLDRESLLSILEYEQTLRENETVNQTLVENESTQSVANLVATTAIREQQAAELRSRERGLAEIERTLADGLASLGNNSNASIRTTFDGIEANTSVNFTEDEYALFAEAVEDRRASADETATTGNLSESEPTSENVTKQILAEEYATLAEDKATLTRLHPSLERQIETLRSRNASEIEPIVADALSGNSTQSAQALAFMPHYYEPGTTETNATLLVVTQETPGGSFAPGDAPAEIEDSQAAMVDLAPDDESMSVLIYGDGIVSMEITDSMIDSVLLVGPLALAFVLFVLVVVYRDPLDILLGLFGIGLVLVWTFGAMGWFGIAFSQPFIVVLVLLIGLSIDYGLHVVMRYREARESDGSAPSAAMAVALGGVGIALVYVTITTVIGFLSNLTSPLTVFRELGIVSAIGIVATLLVFVLLVPALKVELDTVLEGRGFDRRKPAIGTGGGSINRFLELGATLARKAPYVVIVVALLVSASGAYAATDIDASFEQSDFLAEDPDDWVKELPGPIAPGTYTAEQAIDTLDADFVRRDTTATILVRGNVTDAATLDRLDAARENASDMEAMETYAGGEPAVTDPITVMESVAADNESFNQTLAAADSDDDGIPDENVSAVFDELGTVAPAEAEDVIYQDDDAYQAIRMVVTVDSGVDDETVREQMDWIADDVDGEGVTTIATGDVIVNQITADQLAETAIKSLVIALVSVLVVLAIAYRITEGSASLGVVTILPVAFTLTWVLGTMALLDIPFNIVTGMITGLTIGLGVDYSLHVSERFNQELARTETVGVALSETLTGTGGALLSSATTTASGFAVLLVAILPFLQSFWLITALTIVFAFLASVFVLPSLLVVWAQFSGRAENIGTVAGGDEPGDLATANRTIHRQFVLPDQAIPVTVTLENVDDRVFLRESVPGKLSSLDLTPEPVAVDRRNGSVRVFWNTGKSPSEATLEYTVDFTAPVTDGDVFAFKGTIETGHGQLPVTGDETVTVVDDVFQLAVERGHVTDGDVEVAVTRNDVTPTEVERLRRAWLERE